MILVPAGKVRVMAQQNVANPLASGFTEGVSPEAPLGQEEAMKSAEPGDISMEEDMMGDVPSEMPTENVPLEEEDPMGENVVEPMSKGGKSTLTNYIFNKLQEYGYPGRRLEEFKKKFVNQDVSPDGTETVKIEIPDKKYPNPQTGEADTIETKDLGDLVREINSQFGLNFNGAHRSEGRWTIDFTTSEVTSENGEEDIVKDNLDDVYGTPSGKKDGSRYNKASVIQASINEEKDKIISNLKTIIAESKNVIKKN